MLPCINHIWLGTEAHGTFAFIPDAVIVGTTFVNSAPEEVTEAILNSVGAAVDTEVKEENFRSHMLHDQNIVAAGLTEEQAQAVTTSFKSFAETMQTQMLAYLKKEMGLTAKEVKTEEKEEEADKCTEVGKGGRKAGQAGESSKRRANADTIIDDTTERPPQQKRGAAEEVAYEDAQARKQQAIEVDAAPKQRSLEEAAADAEAERTELEEF